MKLNIDEYSAHRKPIKTTLDNRGHYDFKSVASMYAATCACPIFVAYLYAGEVVGYNDWLIKRMKETAEFYDYTSISGDASIDMSQFEVKK